RSRPDQHLRKARRGRAHQAGQGSPVCHQGKSEPLLNAALKGFLMLMHLRYRLGAVAFGAALLLPIATSVCVAPALAADLVHDKSVVDAAKTQGIVGEQGDGFL